MLAEGYEKLSVLRFEEAETVFQQIKKSFADPDKDVENAILFTRHWKDVFSLLDDIPDSEKIFYLFDRINRFEFSQEWGNQKLRSSLINYLIGLMKEHGRFYIDHETALSDLYLQIGKQQLAERSLTAHLNSDPSDTPARFRLAQLQWKQKLKGAALQNYTLGLLLNPDTAPINYLECDKTRELIQKHGPAMTPAYGWIAGILPLKNIPYEQSAVSESHSSALECYRLIRVAEKASKKQDMEATVNHRKALKTGWPELYDEYYALISKRIQPSFY
ncbi:MAG: hypothetical protein EA359_01030 [Balneolaceae bacterium]|nr:MAG: hypothetical protein EA359_01030 [Balneolaceae bacterium]